jgi:hypothetical protein
MAHIILEGDDVPSAPPKMDRRRVSSRREVWRGGRRDSDWLNRPAGALAHFEESRRQRARWRQALASIFLW